jgi:NADPH-dependent curcumin reductase CurA
VSQVAIEAGLKRRFRSFTNLLVKRVTLQGFVLMDNFAKTAEARADITGLSADGLLTPFETVVRGFGQLPTAIKMLFDGTNVGSLVVECPAHRAREKQPSGTARTSRRG